MPFIIDFDPVALYLGPLEVRWYSLAYIAGFLLGRSYMIRLCESYARHNGIDSKIIDDFFVYAIFSVILGGRAGYVFFYNSDYYLDNPLEILLIWNGGMAFHGGLLGIGIAIWWIARRHKISLLALSDLVAAATPIGLFFGRIANFINGELWGHPTTSSVGMIFPRADTLPRHPTQLYEAALEGLILGGILFILIHTYKALAKTGFITGVMLTCYGVFRISVEFVRAPDPHIGMLWGDLTMGQWLSVPLVIFGVILLSKAKRTLANDF